MKKQSEESLIWDKVWDAVHRTKFRCECGHLKYSHNKLTKRCRFYKFCPCLSYKEKNEVS